MKPSEIKNRMISSLDDGNGSIGFFQEMEEAGVSFDFSNDFNNKILSRINAPAQTKNNEVDFIKSMNHVFYRIALTGVAAIVLMLISIFLMEGSLSFNSFLGLGNSYDETTICLLTGK
jgi:hypothetical protein